MGKAEFTECLRKAGYRAELESGVVIAHNAPFEEIAALAKEKGYEASFGCRWDKPKEPTHKVECYEQLSLF